MAPFRPSRPKRRVWPTVLRIVALWSVVAICGIPSASAQFLYLDSNGDGVSSEADVLNPAGEPTNITIYLDTSHNPDSSAAVCGTGQEQLTINSYEVILHAVEGTVSYTNFENLQSSMTTSFGTGSSDTDLYVGYGGATANPPGLYQLASLVVTVQSGAPTLNPASSTPLGPIYQTAFGTGCMAQDQDNTYKLGLDWSGIAGCGPPDGGNAAPAAAAPAQLTLALDAPAAFAMEFSDLDAGDTLSASVHGLPAGLTPVQGSQTAGRMQLRVYGSLGPGVMPGAEYSLVWTYSDSESHVSPESTITILRAVGAPLDPEFVRKVEAFVGVVYDHGMPRIAARQLGRRALPVLGRMLRDPQYKGQWHKIAGAIGFIGDTSYFDTLRVFIWDRFQGPIDGPTFLAVKSAQLSLNVMATISPRALAYLQATVDPAAWRGIRWRAPLASQNSIPSSMARLSVIALGYTDSPLAQKGLAELDASTSDERRKDFVRAALLTSQEVREKGFIAVWRQEDGPPVDTPR